MRAKLSDYYESEGAEDPLRIDLPKGAYAPVFETRRGPSTEFKPVPERTRFRGWRIPALPAAVLLCCVVILVGWKYGRRGAPQQLQSIAVLPFVNLSPDKSNDYFSDGLTEELINVLGRVDDLRVVARTSAFQFKGKAEDIREIGRKLNVGTVLEGSVQKEGNRIRISAHLTNTADGYELWSRTWDRELNDIFTVQEDIAEAVTNTVQSPPGRPRSEVLLKFPTRNLEAYNLYLLGRYYLDKRTESALKQAVEYFEQAIQRDPDYAAAYTGLADSYNVLPAWTNTRSREYYEKAKKAALKALSLDHSLAEAHTSLAFDLQHLDWDWQGAEQEFRYAMKLNPGYSAAHYYDAALLRDRGLFDAALEEMTRGRECDPLSLVIKGSSALLLYLSGREKESAEQAGEIMRMNRSVMFPYRLLGAVGILQGRYDEAIRQLQTGLKLQNDSFCLGRLGYAYAHTGRRTEAIALAQRMQSAYATRYMSPYHIAIVYLGLENLNAAYSWLDKAYDDRDPDIFMLKVEPLWKQQRHDARFVALLEKMRLKD